MCKALNIKEHTSQASEAHVHQYIPHVLRAAIHVRTFIYLCMVYRIGLHYYYYTVPEIKTMSDLRGRILAEINKI